MELAWLMPNEDSEVENGMTNELKIDQKWSPEGGVSWNRVFYRFVLIFG